MLAMVGVGTSQKKDGKTEVQSRRRREMRSKMRREKASVIKASNCAVSY